MGGNIRFYCVFKYSRNNNCVYNRFKQGESMKYNNIIPHWYNVKGTHILIDQKYALVGHYQSIVNQIHRDTNRQSENKPQEDKR